MNNNTCMQSTLFCTCYRLPNGIDPQGNQGDMWWNTRRWMGFFAGGGGGRGNLDIILQAKIRGWGIQKFVKDICRGFFS